MRSKINGFRAPRRSAKPFERCFPGHMYWSENEIKARAKKLQEAIGPILAAHYSPERISALVYGGNPWWRDKKYNAPFSRKFD